MSDPSQPTSQAPVARPPSAAASVEHSAAHPKPSPSRLRRAVGNRDAFGLRVVSPIIFLVGLALATLLIAFGLRVGPFHDTSGAPEPMKSQAIDVTIPDDVGQSPRTTATTSTTTTSKDPPPPATTSKDPPPPATTSKDEHSGPSGGTPPGGQPAAPATSEPPHKLVTVDVPGAVFDRLGPQHDTGLTAPQVAAAAAGVSILVALLALFGVFRTVRGKWVDDQLADIWERFTWIVDEPRYQFFEPVDRGSILLALGERAEGFRDTNLQKVISHFQLTVLEDIRRQRKTNPHAPVSDRTNDFIDLVQQSRGMSGAVKDRAAEVQAECQAAAPKETPAGPVAETTASGPPKAGTPARGHRLVRTSTVRQVPPTSPLPKDAVEKLCDEFTQQLQDAITHGPKTAGRQSDSLDGETMDAINVVAAQHPRAMPDSIASALREFQLQLDGTHYKERDAVRRAAKAGEIASTVTTMELKEMTNAAGGATQPREVEIVLPDHAAARAWILRNRDFPFLSRIYVETVFGGQ